MESNSGEERGGLRISREVKYDFCSKRETATRHWRLLSLLRALKSVFLPRKTRIDRLSQKTYFFFSLAVTLPWMDIFEKK